MPTNSPPARHIDGLACDVLAWAPFRAPAEQIAPLRRSPGTLGGLPIPPSLLRHADEQTVAGLVAVLRAIDEGCLEPGGFDDWAVVAAPRYLGRTMFFKTAFPQFLAESAWGVSPHLISNQSLHSTSGAVSQALRAHGPNLGVGGAPGCELEAFLLAATMLDQRAAPAAWVVITGWNALRPGDAAETGTGEFFGCAVALGPAGHAHQRERLHVLPDSVCFEQAAEPGTARPRLADWLGLTDEAPLTRANRRPGTSTSLPLGPPNSELTGLYTAARDRS